MSYGIADSGIVTKMTAACTEGFASRYWMLHSAR